MFAKLLVTFLSLQLICNIDRVNALIEDVIDVLHLGREVVKTISTTWNLAEQSGVTNDIELPFLKNKEKKIISRMAELTQEFRRAEITVTEGSFEVDAILIFPYSKGQETSDATVQGLEYYIRSNTKLELVIHEMIDLVSRVENIYERYEEYVTHDGIERDTLENFARGVIEDNNLSIKGMLTRIQSLLSGPSGSELRVLGNRGLLEMIAVDMMASF